MYALLSWSGEKGTVLPLKDKILKMSYENFDPVSNRSPISNIFEITARLRNLRKISYDIFKTFPNPQHVYKHCICGLVQYTRDLPGNQT